MPSGQFNVFELSTTGASIVGVAASTAATITTVVGSSTTSVLLAANTSRRGVIVQSEGPQSALVAYAVTATTAAYSVSIPTVAYWEMPPTIYQGAMSVIASSSSAVTLRVTEF